MNKMYIYRHTQKYQAQLTKISKSYYRSIPKVSGNIPFVGNYKLAFNSSNGHNILEEYEKKYGPLFRN